MVVVRVKSPVRLMGTRTVPAASLMRGLDSKNTEVVGCALTAATATATATALRPAAALGGSPLIVIAAVDLAVAVREPCSRLVNPNTAHATDPASGASPSQPVPGTDNNSLPTPTTAPWADAAVIAGAAATAATVDTITDSATEVDANEDETDPGSAVGGEVSISGAGGVKSLTGAGRNSPTATERCGPRRFWPLGTVTSTRGTADPRASISDGATPSVAADGTPPRGVADREPPRDGAARPDVDNDDDDDDDESSTELAVEPSDPVLSANADGSATTAEPIPNATASAPTRPT